MSYDILFGGVVRVCLGEGCMKGDATKAVLAVRLV